MQLRITIVALVLGVMCTAGFAADFDEPAAKKLFEDKCSKCHGIRDYDLGERSLKEWQLTVERMATYGGEDPYTDDEADIIIAFLYLGKHDPPEPGELYDYEKPKTAVAATDTQPTTGPAIAVAAAVPRIKRFVSWKKSKSLGVAKFMGYAATAIMALMVITGLTRKTLKRNFKNIHMVLAILLFGALAIHVSVYLCEYGVPNVLWLWFGIIGSVLIGLVEFGGLVRRKLGKNFIRMHSICGAVGLVLVALHWAWTYMTYQLPV
jgi:hypothetical protein